MITHPEKLMFPDDGITKGELAAYFETIAPYMLPHLTGRPITMERYHRGIAAEGFFQKDVTKGFPKWLERVEVPKKGGTVHHPLAGDVKSLLWLANQNTMFGHRERPICYTLTYAYSTSILGLTIPPKFVPPRSNSANSSATSDCVHGSRRQDQKAFILLCHLIAKRSLAKWECSLTRLVRYW